MPENYFEPFQSPNQNTSPNTPNVGGNNFEEPDLSAQAGQRFTPPSSNVFVRTSGSDLEKMKATGGETQNWQTPPQPTFSPPSPVNESRSPVNEVPSGSNFSEPAINPEISASEFTNFSQPQIPKKNNKLIPLLIIIGIVIGGAVLGYFFLWPKFFASKPVTVTTTQPIVSITTTTLPPSPYPQVSGPYQKTPVAINLTSSIVVSGIKSAVTQTMQPAQTFSILIPKYRDYSLSGEEVITSLIPSLPDNLKPYLLARKYLLYVYYGEVNPSLGLIVNIGQDKVGDVKAVFATWEKGKILDNLANFWLIKIPKKIAKTFKGITTTGADIRYFTYSGKEAAISYGFFNDYLIISSSLESINSAVSHLQGTTEPIYP
ncbi:MAG: hypothetical protein WC306_02590 [Candidatus Paceibacterota bacterium]|jgi:hypothetical protein